MPSKNLDAVQRLARDLRVQEPRSADEELGGFPLAARCIDKCRASLLGWQGDYTYGCPMDQEFLASTGINAQELKDFVATGATDDEVARWIEQRTATA